jgi:Cu/Ag efflux pump CusA
MVSSTILTLIVIPAIYAFWKGVTIKFREDRNKVVI